MSNDRATPEQSELDRFLDKLEAVLYRRYNQCQATVTPDSILLAVCNAIAEARKP